MTDRLLKQHSPEPWRSAILGKVDDEYVRDGRAKSIRKVDRVGYCGENFAWIYDANGEKIAWCHHELLNNRSMERGDVRRIVACVNACKEIPTDVLEFIGLAGFRALVAWYLATNVPIGKEPDPPKNSTEE